WRPCSGFSSTWSGRRVTVRSAPIRPRHRGSADLRQNEPMADRVTEQITIAADIDVVRDVLLDFDRYPDWASDLKSVEVLDTDDEGRGLEVRFRAAAMGRSTSYVLRY